MRLSSISSVASLLAPDQFCQVQKTWIRKHIRVHLCKAAVTNIKNTYAELSMHK